MKFIINTGKTGSIIIFAETNLLLQMTKTEIAFVRSLTDKKKRIANGLFIAEGEKLVRELIGSNLNIRRIFASGETVGSDYGKTPAEMISTKEMERISSLKTPAKVLALVEIPHHQLDNNAAKENLIIALDTVQDPGNMGTILRLADWFGIRDIVCSENTADCFNPKVVQATMGAIARIRVHYVHLPDFLKKAVAGNTPVYGTFLDGEKIYETKLSANGIIVMGSEGKGISSEVEAIVTRRLFIPPYPIKNTAAESLNVATAAAIICSEFRRR